MVASLRLLESVINSAENDEKLQPERDAKLFAKYAHIIQVDLCILDYFSFKFL